MCMYFVPCRSNFLFTFYFILNNQHKKMLILDSHNSLDVTIPSLKAPQVVPKTKLQPGRLWTFQELYVFGIITASKSNILLELFSKSNEDLTNHYH